MTPEQIQSFQERVENMRDALLGSYIVLSLKTESRPQYEALMAKVSRDPSFIKAIDQMNDHINFGILEKIIQGTDQIGGLS